MALTMDEQLLFINIISLEFLAVSIPSNIEKRASLLDKAGLSFIPSPVIATI